MTHRITPSRTGNYGAGIGRSNKERVKSFLERHIGATNLECADALNLSPMAVGRHVAALRAEWEAKATFKLRKPHPSRIVKTGTGKRGQHGAGRDTSKDRSRDAEV